MLHFYRVERGVFRATSNSIPIHASVTPQIEEARQRSCTIKKCPHKRAARPYMACLVLDAQRQRSEPSFRAGSRCLAACTTSSAACLCTPSHRRVHSSSCPRARGSSERRASSAAQVGGLPLSDAIMHRNCYFCATFGGGGGWGWRWQAFNTFSLELEDLPGGGEGGETGEVC